MTQAAIRYSATAMMLHWVIAALIVFNFALGERTEHLPRGPELFSAFQLHKSVGITVLLLSLWRLWARLRHPRPAPAADLGWAKRLSSLVHAGFYVVMIGAPITGWIIVSTAKTKIPTLLFDVIRWPHLPLGGGDALHEAAEVGHEVLAKAAIALLILHVVGAVRHQFQLKDAILERMMPVTRAGIGSLLLAAGLLGGSFALGRAGPLPGLSGVSGAPAPTPPAAAGVNAATVPALMAPEIEQPKTDEEADKKAADEEAKTVAEVSGPVPQWQVTPGGRLGFGVQVSGEGVSGSFARWDAAIAFDPDRLAQSSIKASIDLASVNSGDSERDDMLGGADFFATSAHPRASFVADDIRAKGDGRYEARGMLNIKGQAQPMRVAFTLNIKGDNATAKGTAQIDRRKFSIGTGQFAGDDTVSHAVGVTFAFEARRKG